MLPRLPISTFRAGPAALAVAASLLASGCAQYATVKFHRPGLAAPLASESQLAGLEQNLADGRKMEKASPHQALGQYLTVAESAARRLAAAPHDQDALDTYNFAVARVFGVLRSSKLDPWGQPLELSASEGGFTLTHRPDHRGKRWNPSLYDFTPADEFDIGGKYVSERMRKPGLGAPVVATGRELDKDAAADYAIPRTFYGVTAIIRFDGKRAVVGFEDPLSMEDVAFAGRTYPLAADFTVPLAVMLASTDPKKYELSRLLRPAKYAETARIARLQPYDPDKTVVMVVHGLMDTPATWTPLINEMRGDPDIRRNYQFWFYSYPSGYPYPYSAAILRRELDAIQKRFPLDKKMVVIGHSMGGCITRLLLTDTGDELWKKIFTKSPAETRMAPSSKKLLEEALVFQHRPEVGRAIFISAPLRGADMARHWTGRLGSWLVKSPVNLLQVGADALRDVTFQKDDLKLKRIPNSVDTLAPNNRFVKAIQTFPFAPGIPYHVISGDRGKGGNKDQTKPVMSDGIVPYWSSHLEGARSELVVPSHHSAHQHPMAIAEVKRILKLHAAEDARKRR